MAVSDTGLTPVIDCIRCDCVSLEYICINFVIVGRDGCDTV